MHIFLRGEAICVIDCGQDIGGWTGGTCRGEVLAVIVVELRLGKARNGADSDREGKIPVEQPNSIKCGIGVVAIAVRRGRGYREVSPISLPKVRDKPRLACLRVTVTP